MQPIPTYQSSKKRRTAQYVASHAIFLFLWILALWAYSAMSGAQNPPPPERVYGTADGQIQLFTPSAVVEAGGGGGGGGAGLSDKVPLVESGTGAAGSGTEASRDDHVHPAAGGGTPTPLSDATPKAAGTAAAGAATAASRGDHVHPAELPSITGHAGNVLTVNSGATGIEWAAGGGGGSGGGSLSMVARVNGSRSNQGSPAWIPPAHSSLAFLFSTGTGNNRYMGPFLTPEANSFTVTGALGERAGTCRINRSHENIWSISGCGSVFSWTIYSLEGGGGSGGGSGPSIPEPTAAGKLKHLRVNAAGAAYELADPPTVPGGLIPVGNSGLCVKSAGNGMLRYADCGSPRVLSNHTPKVEGTADPGVDTQVSRSDHVHPSGGGGTPTPLSDATPKAAGTAAAGAATAASRGDHVHPAQAIPQAATATPKVEAGSGAVGTGSTWARDDHVHPSGGSTTPLSDATPKAAGTAAAGAATAASRGDHVHPAQAIPQAATATPKVEAGSGAVGTGTAWARDDHVHPADPGLNPNLRIVRRVANLLTVPVAQWMIPNSSVRPRASVVDWTGSTPRLSGNFNRGSNPEAVTGGVKSIGALILRPASDTPHTETEGQLSEYAVRLYHTTSTAELIIPFVEWPEPTEVTYTYGQIKLFYLFYPLGLVGAEYDRAAVVRATDTDGNAIAYTTRFTGDITLAHGYSDSVPELGDAVENLQHLTQDLTVATTPTPWATSTVEGAGVAVATTSSPPSSGYAATLNEPSGGWPAGARIYARLPRGADKTTYRIREIGSVVIVDDYGGSWRGIAVRSDPAHDYYAVNAGFGGDRQLVLEHTGSIERTLYHGEVPTLQRFIDDNSSKLDIIEGGPVGTGAPALNSVWTINQCAGTGDDRTCDASWQPLHHSQKGTVRTLVQHGTSAANSTTANFTQFNKMRHGEIAAGRGYDDHILIVRHLAGNPQNLHIIQCHIPGIQGDWAATNSAPINLQGPNGSGCSMQVPPDGKITINWTTPLAGQKIAGDSWRLYGVDWQ